MPVHDIPLRPERIQNRGRHPFRESLRIRDKRNALRPTVRATDDDNDWKLFVLSFVAFFVCFYTFFM
ncbi:hypothetical protein GCM10023219_02030 [Stakelama sediminis]|uniref:Transmembrane protein n=1 Tax=Stakelama sediminis TaxID=463200 RepID=A0A840Z0Q3_9SPHN|nr:hypothetical protein [Stakelama sediminis]MBB5719357.1 hypothetical protein [Stakelama sediminis]